MYVRFSAWIYVVDQPAFHGQINVKLVLQDVGGGYPLIGNGGKFVAPCDASYNIAVKIRGTAWSRFSFSVVKGNDTVLFSGDNAYYRYSRELIVIARRYLLKDEYVWVRGDKYHTSFQSVYFFGYVDAT